jgi:hypothetical protein
MTTTPIRRTWPRMLVVQGLQIPLVALVVGASSPAGAVVAGLIGSFICCAGTDSGWRWRNRLLVVQAIGWLVVALSAL